MDRSTRAAIAIKELYKYRNSGNPAPFIKEVCRYYDAVKNDDLSVSDSSFLLLLANEAGVPHYYDLLEDKYNAPTIPKDNVNLLTLGAHIHDRSLLIDPDENVKLHRYQKAVLSNFALDTQNRFVLTAPTSFGKTFIVYEIICKMNYNNILLVFPSISLLSENYQRVRQSDKFTEYRIHTLSDDEYEETEKHIFIFTPERYLSFLDKNKNMRFDFSFVDEIYKIDNSFIIDKETTGESERDIAYRVALNYICKTSCDVLLAGPYMVLPNKNADTATSFANFARDNQFITLNYNNIEIVDKTIEQIIGKQSYTIDGKVIEIGSLPIHEKIANVIFALSTPTENTIVYCNSRAKTESYVKGIITNQTYALEVKGIYADYDSPVYIEFIQHLEQKFGADWIVVDALKNRIGIHHGLIPKYIQKEIISLFNKGILIALFSTTTITEGVNTTAKTVIATSAKKGKKALKQFDAKNIAGRAGRFQQHYMGRVIAVGKEFLEIINGDDDVLEHKNYDEHSDKKDVDYPITDEKYLSPKDIEEKARIDELIQESNIPLDILDVFRVVGYADKIEMYKAIEQLSLGNLGLVQILIKSLVLSKASKLDWNGFQLIIDTIRPIISEKNLTFLVDRKASGGQSPYSIITVLLSAYLAGGYMEMVKYAVDTLGKSKDEAITQTSDNVYNVFKYHLVKYLGLFDIFYRHIISVRRNCSIDDVTGIGLLLQRLEYNALSSNARRLSDFGVPFQLVTYYDQEDAKGVKRFDSYEQHIDRQIQSLLD